MRAPPCLHAEQALCFSYSTQPEKLKEHIEDKTTSLLVQIDNRIRILVMLQIMRLNISYQLYVITKISAIISRYLTAKPSSEGARCVVTSIITSPSRARMTRSQDTLFSIAVFSHCRFETSFWGNGLLCSLRMYHISSLPVSKRCYFG